VLHVETQESKSKLSGTASCLAYMTLTGNIGFGAKPRNLFSVVRDRRELRVFDGACDVVVRVLEGMEVPLTNSEPT